MGVRGWDGPGRQASWGLLNPPCPVDTAGSARKETSRSSAGRVKGSSSLLPVSTLIPVPSPFVPPSLFTWTYEGVRHQHWAGTQSMFDGSIAIEITHSSIFLMVNIFVCNKNNHNFDDNSYQWLIIHLSIHSFNNSHWTPVAGWVPGLVPRLRQQTWRITEKCPALRSTRSDICHSPCLCDSIH